MTMASEFVADSAPAGQIPPAADSTPRLSARTARMAHDVYISYSHVDKAAADAACATLERAGIRCWIAPRDITPGDEWSAAIIKAIDQCRAMVLIFSQNANNSRQIRREVERAITVGIPLVPVRIEDVVPTESLAYFMGTVHWLDAMTPPFDTRRVVCTRVRMRRICRRPATVLLAVRAAGRSLISWSSSSARTGARAARLLRAASVAVRRARLAVTAAVTTSVPSAIAIIATTRRVRRRRVRAVTLRRSRTSMTRAGSRRPGPW